MLQTAEHCPLCHTTAGVWIEPDFLDCPGCRGIYRPQADRPDPGTEKARYLLHQNSPADKGYLRFLSPLIEAVKKSQSPHQRGLDFGSGPQPVLSDILLTAGYRISPYDPFFCPVPDRLQQTYDFILCCEVMEHFHEPAREFALLNRLLKPGGRIYAMTALFHEGIDFAGWHYKNDITHLFFYRPGTLDWIEKQIGFSTHSVLERLIIFEK